MAGIIVRTVWVLNHEQKAERAKKECYVDFETSNSRKATFPKYTQVLLLTGDKVFKHLNLWGTFSFSTL